MTNIQFTLLREHAARLLQCAASEVAVHAVQLHTADFTPTTSQNIYFSPLATGIIYVETLSVSTALFATAGDLELLHKHKTIVKFGKVINPFNGVLQLGFFVDELYRSTPDVMCSISGYRFYKADNGLNPY